jgi:hypothetical protein
VSLDIRVIVVVLEPLVIRDTVVQVYLVILDTLGLVLLGIVAIAGQELPVTLGIAVVLVPVDLVAILVSLDSLDSRVKVDSLALVVEQAPLCLQQVDYLYLLMVLLYH